MLYTKRNIDGWVVLTIHFADPSPEPLLLAVRGLIGNSVPTSNAGKARTANWKVQVASAVMEARGTDPWNPSREFAISLGMRFHSPSHGHGRNPLDPENFIKPVIDAVAAGLFCELNVDPAHIQRWDFDDSNFRTLLVHRLTDAETQREEGVAISISSR